MKLRLFSVCSAFTAAALVGCSSVATVSDVQPHFTPVRSTIGALADIGQKFTQGLLISLNDKSVLLKSVLLTGHPKEASLANGDPVSVTAQRTGTFQYKEASGETKMVQKFKVAKSP